VDKKLENLKEKLGEDSSTGCIFVFNSHDSSEYQAASYRPQSNVWWCGTGAEKPSDSDWGIDDQVRTL
jgi:hypothetical protein